MKKHSFLLLFLLLLFSAKAQNYDDYLGAGHTGGITVTTSSDMQQNGWTKVASGNKTITGDGLDAKLIEASRLLSQATFGADRATIEHVAEIGIEAWIEEQFALEPTNYLETIEEIYNYLYNYHVNNGGDPEDYPWRPNWSHFNYGWWEITMSHEDLLAQRISYALSQIMVVSINSDLQGYGDGLADFYDIFSRNAFGNFRDILREVTYHPSMGHYLSHLNNPKEDEENNIHPDENYAREVMQLFSIGLYELNDDGSHMTDNEGNSIPTYDNYTIKEFAKIFTGLGLGGVIPNDWVDQPYFGLGFWVADVTTPMVMYEEQHQQGEKYLLNGHIVPAGQSGDQDIEDAIDNLFNHHNVGPFIGRQLIQRLVKSNPSPEYIARVTAAFNDNGNGVRGDMKAVIRAILLDEEARSCDWMNEVHNGKLREPILKYTQFAKSIGYDSPSGKMWNIGWGFRQATSQYPLASPSVFNFYLPDFQPIGEIAEAGLVAPEFQIYNTRTSIGFVNEVQVWTIWEYLWGSWEDEDHSTYTDFTAFIEASRDPEVLLNELDIRLTNGQLSDYTRQVIKDALLYLDGGGLYLFGERVRLGTYLIMISPDYAVMR
ncbi:MAG: DUF1800 domain-containing protein [Bacteroidetes bacterium]|nr:MAG: DUF1800 domain-containing protein [Bacteroidota bacterium]